MQRLLNVLKVAISKVSVTSMDHAHAILVIPVLDAKIIARMAVPDVANASKVAAYAWQGGVVSIALKKSAAMDTVIVIFLTHVFATRDGWEHYVVFRCRARIRLVIRMVIASLGLVNAKEVGLMIFVVQNHLNVIQHAQRA